MKTNLIKAFGILALFGLMATAASAQFTITIPKIPKIKKEKPPTATAPTDQRPDSSGTTSNTGASDASPAARGCSSDPVAEVHLGDLEKTRKQAEEFRPGLRDYYVSTLSDRKNLYLEAALSPSRRKEWLGGWSADFVKCLDPALEGLAAVARKTLPAYTGPAGYTLGTPAEKKALLSAIDDLAEAKILKVGIKQANWLIANNDYGIPTARYKHGVVWAQYADADDGFCRIYWINIKQDYAGGGTYGASYGYFVSRAFAGCPAGK